MGFFVSYTNSSLRRRLFVVVFLFYVVITLCIIYLSIYPPHSLLGQFQLKDEVSSFNKQVSSFNNKSYVEKCHVIQKPNRTQFMILMWTKYYGIRWFKKDRWVHCGKLKCYIASGNHSLLPYADALVFHGYEYDLLQEIKEALSVPRLTHQYWIYHNLESSLRTLTPNIAQYEPVFNWTMTYKLDSDIVCNYARVLPGKYLDGFNSTKNYFKGRTHTAFAIISNCFKPRLDYIHEMQKYIDIDLYGKCPGHKPFCRNCWKIAKEKYKFYLAFENSLCTDYITEKTYTNAFTHELVPVIISGANLSNPLLMPQGSYVNARSYSSAKRLATYLMKVINNSTLYNNFFKWRAEWKIVNQWDYKGLECSICEKLYESNEVKIYNNIYSWFNRSKECVDWSVIQRI